MALVAREWDGLTLQARIHRACGRAIIGVGMAAAVETKRITHRHSGTLARSVHVAEAGRIADEDEDMAEAAHTDLLMSRGFPEAKHTPDGTAVEVGSWLPYACVEWVGRGHPGITQGLEAVRGARATMIVRQAFMEEGL